MTEMNDKRVNRPIALTIAIIISIVAIPQLLNGVSFLFHRPYFYGLGKIVGAIVIPGYFL